MYLLAFKGAQFITAQRSFHESIHRFLFTQTCNPTIIIIVQVAIVIAVNDVV